MVVLKGFRNRSYGPDNQIGYDGCRGLQSRGCQITPGLERPQEVEDILAIPNSQPIETIDDFICLATGAPVGFDSLHQITCPSVMEQKDALPDAPLGAPFGIHRALRSLV